ncbi:LPXTG cell wall anchor domain-containing protein [Loigolactobacillus binensis]|uniref:LPXTG cell wall anchor domain-containing protein n=1 Tax=Loigolactobacillus binensis TaxID=2559922 RepID=A0ABW3EB76_9LACO|nr:LPXTG cell wall anchor domain-containing protein [Loigolactobacillus binensis]
MKVKTVILGWLFMMTLLGGSTLSQGAVITSQAQTSFVTATKNTPTVTKPRLPYQSSRQEVQTNQYQQSVLPQTSERSGRSLSLVGILILVSLASIKLQTKFKQHQSIEE